MVAGTFSVYAWAIQRGLPVEAARTMVVNALVVMEIFYLFSVRYVHGSSLTWIGVLGTRAVLIGVALVIAAQFAFTYLPWMQTIFASRSLSVVEGAVVIAAGILLLFAVEIARPHFLALGIDMLPCARADALRGEGMPVVAWTVRDPSQWSAIKDHCDNLIFEGFHP